MNDMPEMPTPDTPQVLLEHHLKALRLTTILSEYDKVARQCAAIPAYRLRPPRPDFRWKQLLLCAFPEAPSGCARIPPS